MPQHELEATKQFSGEDLLTILESGGWEEILPKSQPHHRLVSLANQLRGFLCDEGELEPGEDTPAAVTLALLLLPKVDPSSLPFDESLPWVGKEKLLREILIVLFVAVHQKIVNRLLNRPNDAESLAVQTGIRQPALRKGGELIEKWSQKLSRTAKVLPACCCAQFWCAAAGNKNACALP